jgi:hypothetical protein
VAARVRWTHRESGFRPRREGSIVTNPAGRDKPDAGGAEKPVGPSDGVPGRRHPRVAAEEIDDVESDALPADQLHAAHGVRTARRSKRGQYRAKTHRLIKGAEERKVRTGRRDHFVGDVPMTRLNGKLVSGESFLEIDALTVRDFDGGFHDVIAQPFKTSLFVGSKKRRWTPDFLFLNSGRAHEVVEVKMLSWLYHKDPAKATLAKKRLDAMEGACATLGFTFTLLTEDEIRVEPRLYNAKMAQRHCGPLVPESSIVLGLSALAAAPDTITIREFGDMIGPLHPIHGLGLAIKLERLSHVRIDRREKYSFSSTMTKTAALETETSMKVRFIKGDRVRLHGRPYAVDGYNDGYWHFSPHDPSDKHATQAKFTPLAVQTLARQMKLTSEGVQ